MKRLELTFAIIKPHVIKNPMALKDIQDMIIRSNFNVVKSKRYKLKPNDAAKFYEEHKNKFFYNRLVTFMVSGPSDLYILARENAIEEWRKLMGPTKVLRTQFENPDTIRGKFGLSDTRNATHGSDSPESVKREIGIFYPDFSIDSWYNNEEYFFRMKQIKFNEKEFVHVIDESKLSMNSAKD